MARKKKQTRGPRGDGSIFPDKRRGGWIAKVPIGRDPDTGKLIYERVRAKTQDAVRKLRDAAKPAAVTPTMTLAQWCDRWLGSHDVREQSRDVYEQCVRLRIKPTLGHVRLSALTPVDIEVAARAWGTTVGAATVRKTIATLSAALQTAHRGDLVPRNAARPARKPSAPKTDIDPFTPAELRAIVRAGVARPEWRVFAVLASTGTRIGEALALRPGDYDPAGGRLTIARTRTRRHGAGAPKSARSDRVITVPREARPALAAGLDQAGETVTRRRWAKLLESLGLRHRNPHQMRHSVATHAIAAGTPLANVARDLGDTVETIVRTYLHPTDDGRDVCAAMDRLFSGS